MFIDSDLFAVTRSHGVCYQRLGEISWQQVLGNVGNYVDGYTVSQHRTPRLKVLSALDNRYVYLAVDCSCASF
jgi:hypothetical protein